MFQPTSILLILHMFSKVAANNRHIKISFLEFARNAVMVLQLHLDHTEYGQFSHFRLDSFLQHLAAAEYLAHMLELAMQMQSQSSD